MLQLASDAWAGLLGMEVEPCVRESLEEDDNAEPRVKGNICQEFSPQSVGGLSKFSHPPVFHPHLQALAQLPFDLGTRLSWLSAPEQA